MKLYRDGDVSRAFCSHCAKVVKTVFARRDVPFNDAKGSAKNILVGVCNVCDSVVSIPAQSTPAIRRARKPAPDSLEANLPAVYVDLLDYAVYTIDEQASTDFRRLLLTYFVHKAALDESAPARLKQSHQQALERFPERRGSARWRLSMKVPSRLAQEMKLLEDRTSLNTTELLKSLVYVIQDKVLARPRPSLIDELRALSAVAA